MGYLGLHQSPLLHSAPNTMEIPLWHTAMFLLSEANKSSSSSVSWDVTGLRTVNMLARIVSLAGSHAEIALMTCRKSNCRAWCKRSLPEGSLSRTISCCVVHRHRECSNCLYGSRWGCARWHALAGPQRPAGTCQLFPQAFCFLIAPGQLSLQLPCCLQPRLSRHEHCQRSQQYLVQACRLVLGMSHLLKAFDYPICCATSG